MPTIKQLEEFTEHFRTIGNEASLTAGRGEPYNALPLPETEPAGNSFAEAEVSAPENLSNDSAHIDAAPIDDFDFGAYLDTLPDDLQEHPNGTDSSNTENIDSADLDNADVDPADLDPFNFDDGLGDLLSGFADDIESVQNEPDIPDDFTEPEFSDPDIPGNAIDADFEELGNLRNLEDSNNLAGMNDFPNSEMGDFNFSEGLNESPNS
jgi:hypothetical protein